MRKLHDLLDVNIEWLLLGTGEMLPKSKSKNDDKHSIKKSEEPSMESIRISNLERKVNELFKIVEELKGEIDKREA